jgi:LysM repeat protein
MLQGDAGLVVPPAWLGQKYTLPVAAQQGTIVRFQPPTVTLNITDLTDLEIRIDNVSDLITADVTIQFNPAVLQVQDANSDPNDGLQIQLGNFPSPEFVARNEVTNTQGTIIYTVTDLDPFQPVSGNGLMATIRFEAVALGSSEIKITEAILINSQLESIPNTTQSAQITVGQGPTSTPTNTPVPGQATATFTPIPLPGSATPILGTETPTPTPTLTPSPTATVTPTPSPTPTATNTPVPPAVKIPAGATVGFCYRVQFGETLYSLGQKFSLEPHFISVVNDLYPADYVYPQQILFMPEQYGTGPNVYMVKPGDTLAGIAEACKLDAAFIAAVNEIPPDANLAEVVYLLIPRPPYPPPSRYPFPPSPVWPPACESPCNR